MLMALVKMYLLFKIENLNDFPSHDDWLID